MPIKTANVEGVGEVTIIRKRGIRSMRLNVDNQGTIRLTLPWWVSAHIGLGFVLSKSDWISNQKTAVEFTPVNDMEFGKGLRLHIETSAATKPSKRFDSSTLTIRVPQSMKISDETINQYVIKSMTLMLRTQAEDLLIPRIRLLAEQHGFKIKSCTIKLLKARWGSCNQDHDIVINLYLIQLPWEIIDYVLLHELNHTKHLYHGPVFWSALEEVCPTGKQLRKQIRKYQPRLYDGIKAQEL